MSMKIKLKKIEGEKNLAANLIFIKNGFKFSNKLTSNIFKSLIKHNKLLGYYGFSMEDSNHNIIGAIITLHQGEINIKGKNYSVINISNWYVDKKHRGYKSILMAKYFTKELSENIVTNLSANEYAEPIFKALGYKRSETFTTNYYINQYLFYALSKRKWHSGIQENSKSIELIPKNLYLRDSFYISFIISNFPLSLLITKSKACKKIFNLSICLPRINIVWSSDSKLLRENYQIVLGYLMFKFNTQIISCHCLKFEEDFKDKIWRNHFYYFKKSIKDQFPIIGSEYSVGL